MGENEYSSQRAQMLSAIEQDIRSTSSYTGLDTFSPAVMTAMRTVPRHEFVPDSMKEYAYWNRPLPIGHGQTISQPYIVALMTELAQVKQDSVVLEVGTGSGYQAAVLAEIVNQVYTIEIVRPLGLRARETLQRLGYANIEVRIGDGYHGWPDAAPFDAILVTAAPEKIPQPLIDQLKTGGRMVIPIGPQGQVQSLKVLEKSNDGRIVQTDALPVSFVPLTGNGHE
ncbi:MAG: protein-L-isoaspartate(D-aspartate) O-methyltransferase [Gammaproteobacteria bacterium]|nr:protein-L-isoaspartate(D-aspartate) O-methyltransferase [Gammaproteobacteria bacterium]